MTTRLQTMGAALLAASMAHGDIFVSTTGDDLQSGANWAEAVATLETAVTKAGGGGTIHVSNGVYQAASEIALTDAITLRGIGAPEEVVVAGLGGASGSRVFRLAHAGAVLENLTVTGGGVPADDLKGAGVYLAEGTVRNCVIAEHNPTPAAIYGVGLYMSGGVASNSTIRNNYGLQSRGSGVCVEGGLLADCLVEDNGSSTVNNSIMGGGLYLTGAGVVSNCTIRANAVRSTSARGAGIWMDNGHLLRCRIIDNVVWSGAHACGGGIYMAGGLVENGLVVSNWSNGSSGGGGILMTGGTVAHSTIAMNRAIGNGVWDYPGTGQGPTGAGIQWGYINGNSERIAGGGTVTNCIIYNNLRSGSQAQINLGGWGDYTNAFFFCCSRDLPPGVNGNIQADPLFIDPENGDFRLRPDSPCLDAGFDLGLAEDLAGQPRKRDGTGTGVAAVDIGAYERPAADSMFQCHFQVATNEAFHTLAARFTARVSGPNTNGLSYYWDFGNGTLAGEGLDSVTRSYPEHGTYAVTLTVSNALNQGAAWTRPDCIRVGAPIAYVAPNGGNIAPYDTWAKAATSIQAALAAAVVTPEGATRVVVSNGTYNLAGKTDSIFIDRGLVVESVNGAAETLVWNQVITDWVYPCFDLDHPDAVIDGFTIGNANMGVALHRGAVRNCIIRNNTGHTSRPNAVEGKGNYGGQGGGVAMYGGLVEQCLIVSNQVLSTRGCGAGALIVGGLMRNCTLAYNKHPGGSAARGGGVMLYDALNQATLRNCLLLGNEAGAGGYTTAAGGGIALQGGRVESCTVVSNHITRTTGSGTGGGIHQAAGSVVNTILAGNTLYFTTPNDASGGLGTFSFSRALELTPGVNGNIVDPPRFVASEEGNYRLAEGSPCINTGSLLDWMAADATDLAGLPRVQSRKPDMGCYEFVPPPGSIILLR